MSRSDYIFRKYETLNKKVCLLRGHSKIRGQDEVGKWSKLFLFVHVKGKKCQSQIR